MSLDPNRRQVLLPPYMEDVEAWQQLIEVVDDTFTWIDNAAIWMGWLRDTWILSDAQSAALEENDVLTDSENFEPVERDILIRQANMLGFRALNPAVLSDADYRKIVRYLPQYWYSQGTNRLEKFLGFILDVDISITPLWAQDLGLNNGLYNGFTVEEDIGMPVWKGGTWFPTTHVRIRLPPERESGDIKEKIEQLFKVLSNYNLVLHSIEQDQILDLRTVDSAIHAPIVILEGVADHTQDVPTSVP